MEVQTLNFNYNVSLKTINCLNAIDFTYHVNDFDYPHFHTHADYWEFTVVTSGAVKNVRNGKEEAIIKDTLFISTPDDTHLIEKVGDEPLTMINLICRERALKTLIDPLYDGYFEALAKGKKVYPLPKYVIYMLESTVNIINAHRESDWKSTNAALKATVISLISHLFISDLEGGRVTEKWESVLNALKTDESFYGYNVNELCQRLGYSRAQLNRIFFAKYGLSPHDYLIRCKLDYAAGLLAYTDYSVAEICSRVGYDNQTQFNKKFKEKFGVTPLEYKNGKSRN